MQKLFLAFVAVQYATADRVRECGKTSGIAIIHTDTEVCILRYQLLSLSFTHTHTPTHTLKHTHTPTHNHTNTETQRVNESWRERESARDQASEREI